MPEPLSGAVTTEALVETESVPTAVPVVEGANCNGSETLAPASTVIGKVVEARENPAPLTVAEVTVPATSPVLVRVAIPVVADPTATCPNEMVEGEIWKF